MKDILPPPPPPPFAVDMTWRIEVEPRWYGAVANVPGRGMGLFRNGGPSFARRSREKAIAAAKQWCDRQETIDRKYKSREQIGYDPQQPSDAPHGSAVAVAALLALALLVVAILVLAWRVAT